ncbi:hypothetical protein B296_00006927 [Ensete ventricosum]|uniref:Uncharacterized protein n=1 Tax=Ensete ventricosum TaxID=4639 RepID=A0A426ZZ92_ENSVE|nr:hypothetical protein B296_00006927 [Ensete ventricosum]
MRAARGGRWQLGSEGRRWQQLVVDEGCDCNCWSREEGRGGSNIGNGKQWWVVVATGDGWQWGGSSCVAVTRAMSRRQQQRKEKEGAAEMAMTIGGGDENRDGKGCNQEGCTWQATGRSWLGSDYGRRGREVAGCR